MSNKPDFLEVYRMFQLEERARKSLRTASTEELQKIWEAWDGTSTMQVDGVYVPDSWMHAELLKRGVDTGI